MSGLSVSSICEADGWAAADALMLAAGMGALGAGGAGNCTAPQLPQKGSSGAIFAPHS
jgi:hypothetical protein